MQFIPRSIGTIRAVIAALIATVALTAMLASTAAAESDGTRWYAMKNRESGRYLAANGSSGISVDPKSSADAQLWRWMASPLKGMLLKNKATGRCLDLEAGFSGAPLAQRSCSTTSGTQQWLSYWEPDGTPFETLRNMSNEQVATASFDKVRISPRVPVLGQHWKSEFRGYV